MCQDIRIDIPEQNKDKFKQVLLYILDKVGAKSNVGKTVICKLLYFIDFDFYELYEMQLMGLVYIKNHYGPTPQFFQNLIDEMLDEGLIEEIKTKFFYDEMTKYIPVKKPDLTNISALELNHINNILDKYSDLSAKQLSDLSHKDIPWIGAKFKEVIPYEAVFYRNSDTSIRCYND